MNNTIAKVETKTITNGDHIRNMTNEALAWVLQEFRFDAYAAAMGGEAALPNSQKEICEWLDKTRTVQVSG